MKHLCRRSSILKRLFSSPSPRPSGLKCSEEKVTAVVTIDSGAAHTPKPTWRCFSYEEMHKATNGFHRDNLIGRGGYAEVYRGEVENGVVIAVKRLTRAATDEQKEKDFLTELGTVGHVRHPNVTSLMGCCIDRDLHLIFNFSSRGSVSSNLHNSSSPPMEWRIRYKIAAGTARGLHYLHKISDFGLAKWLPSEWIYLAVAPIEGTFGCLAPEYFTHGIVDEKTDVFAFGVFLLEIISGRKPVDGFHKSLLGWAKPYINDGKLEILVDSRLGEDYDIDQLKRLTFIASLCIRADAAWRPSMTEVLGLIEKEDMLLERWKMPESAAEDDDDYAIFDDLDDCDTPTSSLSIGSS